MKKTQKGSKKQTQVSESESGSESSDSESSQEATPKLKSRKKAKKGKKEKWRRVEAESESEGDVETVEVIADVEPLAKEPEVVEDTSDDQGQVSMTRLSRMIKTHPKILGWPQ